MPPQKKSMLQYIGVIITALGVFAGIVSAFAVTNERVAKHETAIENILTRQEVLERYNTDEHKLILQGLSRVETILKERRQ